MPTTRWIDNNTVCLDGDTFSKDIGRTIATGRLDAKPFRVAVSEDQGSERNSPLMTVLCHAATNEKIPHSARREILRYLKERGITDPSTMTSGLEVEISVPHIAPHVGERDSTATNQKIPATTSAASLNA